jgi:2-keto-3-deoxy-L-fuconate dehydrogenase
MTTLKGKVALIAGTSLGIGAALARLLDEPGVRLGLASRRGDDLGLDAVAQPCVVRDPEQLESLVGATVERFGRLDIPTDFALEGGRGRSAGYPHDRGPRPSLACLSRASHRLP